MGGGAVAVMKAELSEKPSLALQRQGPEKQEVEDADKAVGQRAERAEAFLRGAGTLVRPGGLLVYVTTSLQKRENDETVRKFLHRTQGEFSLVPGFDDWPIADAEATQYGTTVLPDQGTKHGP